MLKIYNFQCNLKRGSYKELPYKLNGENGTLRINLCSYVDIPSECTNKNIESTSVLFVSDKGDCSVLLSDSKSKN